jgi:hypothetical protein
VRILLPVAVGFLAITGCCCCGSSLEDLESRFRPTEKHTETATTVADLQSPTKEVEPPPAGPPRVLKGDLAQFPDFLESELQSFSNGPTLTSATLTVDDAHPPTEVVAFYRNAALGKGYFIDSEIVKGPQPSFQAIRGNVTFRVVARDEGDRVQYSLTTERTL